MNDEVQLRQLDRDDLQFDAAVVRTDPLDPRIQVVGGRVPGYAVRSRSHVARGRGQCGAYVPTA
jgi:hypothetical protein